MDDDDYDDFDDVGEESGADGASTGDGAANGAHSGGQSRADERAARLGYRPQKEVAHNRLLPYSEEDVLDGESKDWFERIKGNLIRSLAVGDVRPGFVTWVTRLNKYIRFYGLKFPKSDHLALVKLLFGFTTQPDLEPWLVNKSGGVLIALLRKKELLKREDLTLPWRPLYELYERLLFSPYEPFGMLHFPAAGAAGGGRGMVGAAERRIRHLRAQIDKLMYMMVASQNCAGSATELKLNLSERKSSLESTLRQLVRCSRDYFPAEATAEMLDEWRPLLCPFDVTMGKAMAYFEMFLPTLDVSGRAETTYKLWFGEFMSFWEACLNAPPWEPHLMALYARLADHNIGEIDWEPYTPTFFTRIQKNFNLPVMYKNTNVGNKSAMVDVQTSCKWIVASLGGNSSTQRHLDQMFQCLESYYHSANHGRHSQKLSDFLVKLVTTFTRRLHRERHAKERWGFSVPPERRLTDADVAAFVETIKPIALQSVYSKTGLQEAGTALQHLATLKPRAIIPPLVERMHEALDTLTEPHKLTACMHAVVSVSRSLVYPEGIGEESGYPEGPTHVLPLLMATLPGIDPNDMRKAMVTFQFLSTFCTLVPMVDSSEAHLHYPELTEEERVICGQTAQIEDFVVQFLDRCFLVIESSVFEQTRQEVSTSDHQTNKEDSMKDIGMASTFNSILVQASAQVFDAALRKLQDYVHGRILETKISGKIAASLCRCLCKNRPEKGLPVFLVKAVEKASALLHGEDLSKEETLDDELKFNLLLIAECIRVPGTFLLDYIPSLEPILEKTLHMASKDGYNLGCSILRNIFRALTLTFPIEYRAIPEGYDRPLKDYLSIKDWGKPGNINDLKLQWHIPSEAEMSAAQSLIDRFLAPELEGLEQFAAKKLELSKEQVRTRLVVLNSIVLGCGSRLPFWGEEKAGGSGDGNPNYERVTHMESRVDATTVCMSTAPPGAAWLSLKGGQNVREAVAETLFKVQARMIDGDDTKSLYSLVTALQSAVLFCGTAREDYDARLKSYHVVRRALENRLVGGRRQIRALTVDRALLQHEQRMLERARVPFTKLHARVLHVLLDLSISHYSYVRGKAQDCLSRCMSTFSHSYLEVMPRLLELIKKKEGVEHEQFKGALYVILGYKNRSLLTKHNWAMLEKLWPALTSAQHNEKPSIIKLFDWISEAVFRGLDTFAIKVELSDEVRSDLAKAVFESDSPLKPRTLSGEEVFPESEERSKGLAILQQQNEANLLSYHGIIDKLCEQLESGTMHWRHYNMALGLIGLLARYDEPLPARAISLAAKNLVHDDIIVRKLAIHLVGCACKQQKRKHPKIAIKPVPEPGKIPVVPGDRPDNEFMVYDPSRAPKTAAEWDEPRYIHKTHWGFYTWPNEMMVYAPQAEQPSLDRKPEDMNEVERSILDFFSSPANVEKLMGFLSLEEHKGRDRFDSRRFTMFKGLFRNYGDAILEPLKPHMERLVEGGTESGHRCVAEILAALIRGSKHWSFQRTGALGSWAAPLVRSSMDKVSVETIGDWGTCFATASESRDPNRIHWMLEVLMEEPLQSRGAFMDSSRLYVLQGAVAQQEWRAGRMLHRLMDFLRPYCSHPYKAVRDRMGSVLTNIFLNDLDFADRGEASNKRSPRIGDFIKEVVPQLEVLTEEPDPELLVPRIPGAMAGVTTNLNGAGPPIAPMMVPRDGMVMIRPPGPPPINGGGPVLRMPMPRMPPPPEVLAQMRMPPPGAVIPPELLARLPGPPPPELLARLPGPITPEVLARMPPPEVLAGIAGGQAPPPEIMAQMMAAFGPAGPPPPEVLMAMAQGMPPMGMEGEESVGKGSEEYEKRQTAIRLAQTVCKFLAGSLMRGFNGLKRESYLLLPVLCMNESNEFEPHLAKDCTYTLACLSQSLLPVGVVDDCLSAVETVASGSPSWKAKCAVLDVLGTTVFSNMPLVLSRPGEGGWVERVMAVVTAALADDRVEVREKAASVLGGLVHCRFIDAERRKKLLATFHKSARAKLKGKKRKAGAEEEEAGDEKKEEEEARLARAVVRRHSGVLGLCAFVSAHPYDVPEFVPTILMHLSDHLQDPQPINASVKKTLQEFKRTHQDNWQEHKQRFSEDELAVLTDLLVSPSYYA